MSRTTSATQPGRALPALVALCYALLSLILPFQHHHHVFGEEMDGVRENTLSARATRASDSITVKSLVQTPRSLHCMACEWEAINVSPALPAFTLTFVPPPVALRVVTRLPRYLQSQVFDSSSRAPPHA